MTNNAALAYWQAFALLPELDEQREAARKRALAGGPIDPAAIEIVESCAYAMQQMHRGAGIPHCNWGPDVEAGVDVQLPYVAKSRELARFACLRAQVRFEQQRPAEAIDGLIATMTLGRHIAADGILISLLVGIAIDDLAIETAASYLPSLTDDHLSSLTQKLDALDEGKNMGHAMRMEKKFFLDCVINDLSRPEGKAKVLRLLAEAQSDVDLDSLKKLSAADLIEALGELRSVYDQLAEMMALPPDEVDELVKKLTSELESTGPVNTLGSMMLPAAGKVRRAEAHHQTHVAMLKAAIAVVQGGKEQLKQREFQDPFGSGPFAYSTREDGFVLRSQLIGRDGKPVSLSFGPAPADKAQNP